MHSGFYVTLSGQMAIDKRLTTVATNVANMNTVGYRASEISFQALLSKAGDKPVAFASSGQTYISRQSGTLIRTDNPLDIAVQGDGWLAIQTPAGTVYTRDGRMRMQASGALETINGHPVLDAGNTAILLDPDAGAPTISRDGMITQSGRQIGAVGLFRIDASAKLKRYENSGVIPDKPAVPVLEFDSNGVAQGHIEGANVNPVMEMAKLMMLSRTFETINATQQSAETAQKDAIKTLGSSS
jgi:flagellar basal-body rod protein FlgF